MWALLLSGLCGLGLLPMGHPKASLEEHGRVAWESDVAPNTLGGLSQQAMASSAGGPTDTSIFVSVTIHGNLGPCPPAPEWTFDERRQNESRKWVLMTIMQALQKIAPFKITTLPWMRVSLLEPWKKYDESEPDAWEPLSWENRTQYQFRFDGVPRSTAEKATKGMCDRFGSKGWEMQIALIRALDNADTYPNCGMQIIERAHLGLDGLMMLRSTALSPDKQLCRDKNMKLFHSMCPVGKGGCLKPWMPWTPLHNPIYIPVQNSDPSSVKCGENAQRLLGEPFCRCKRGYTNGNNDTLELNTSLNNGQRPKFMPPCLPMDGFCKGSCSDEEEPMVLTATDGGLQDVERAKGRVREMAWPHCSSGHKPSGHSTCQESGEWEPPCTCMWEPPKEPPRPICHEPSHEGVTFSRCDECLAQKLNASWEQEGRQCLCNAKCEQGWRRIGGIAEGPKKCLDVPFSCPSSVRWHGGKCLDEGSEQPTHDFCCDEPWGDGVKRPDELLPVKCTDQRSQKSCLTGMQIEGLLQGAPCCWAANGFNNGTCAAKGQFHADRSDKCAVGPHVPNATWEEFPTCAKMCSNPFHRVENLNVSGCDCCVALSGEACDCTLTCKIGERIGGGVVGRRDCAPDGDFGPAPVCLERDMVEDQEGGECHNVARNASFLESMGLRVVEGCHQCRPDRQLKGADATCICKVRCRRGHILVRGHDPTELQCHKSQKNVAVVGAGGCEDISIEQHCLHSAESKDAPCCWRGAGFVEGRKCVGMGSPFILQDRLPDMCARIKEAIWGEFPQCAPVCPNIFKADPPGGGSPLVHRHCDECTVHLNCSCQVQCPQGHVHVGGGSVGRRLCSQREGEEPSFGLLPVCRRPEPGEHGGGSPECREVDAHESTTVTGCKGLRAGHEDLLCNVTCAEGFGDFTDNVGRKRCHPEEVKLPEASCLDLRDANKCLSHRQADGGPECCWNKEGLANNSWPCSPRGWEFMEKVPSHCARVSKGVWETMPSCVPLCSNTYRDEEEARHLLVENCDMCATGAESPGPNCSCMVRCANGFERKGGGTEGPKNCSKDSPVFPDAPVCLCRPGNDDCKIREPTCAAPSDLSLTSEGCDGCEPGNECESCSMSCADGYGLVDSGATGPQRPTCKAEDSDLTEVESCSSLRAERCLFSKDSSGKACCFREKGFNKGGGGHVCIEEHSTNMEEEPDKCADKKVARWDPESLPICAQRCDKSFRESADRGYQWPAGECEGCLADQPCKRCSVKCEPPKERYGGGQENAEMNCTATDLTLQGGPYCQAPPPPPNCSDLEQNDSLAAQGCSGCAAGKACPGCSVECADGYALLPGSPSIRAARCEEQDMSWPSGSCAEAVAKKECLGLTQLVAGKGAPCCWLDFERHDGQLKEECLPKGSANVTRRVECTPLVRAEWGGLPSCAPLCAHDFGKASNVKFSATCDQCIAGKPCECHVSCKEGFERHGGGSEGPRGCPQGAEPSELLEKAPLCLQPQDVQCRRDEVASDNSHLVQGTCDCKAAAVDCDCNATCRVGFKLTGGEEGDLQCREADAKTTTVQHCSELADEDKCLESLEGAGQLCCWRKEGFTRGNKCAAKGSADITLERPPSDRMNERPKCTATKVGVWSALPRCTQMCDGSVFSTQYVNATSCDECTPDDCQCKVTCNSPFFPTESSVDEGPVRCEKGVKRPQFAAGPDCRHRCARPDHKNGTLNVTCTDDARLCTAGDENCSCTVKCMGDLVEKQPSSGKQEKKCKDFGNDAGADYTDLPRCRPNCAKPQDTQLNATCSHRCSETTAEPCCSQEDSSCCHTIAVKCNCSMKCLEGRQGGGPEGQKICMFFPGNETSPAWAEWVEFDLERGLHFPDEIGPPACHDPLVIKVVDAETKYPISGATVTLHGKREHENETDDKGQAKFYTFDGVSKIKAMREDYMASSKTYDPGARPIQIALLPAKGLVEFDSSDCAAPSRNFTIRAVLEWDTYPQDLDIWGRSWDCWEDTRIRYEEAFKKKPIAKRQHKIWNEFYKMNDNNTTSKETVACASLYDPNQKIGNRTSACNKFFPNQYPKWVTWGTRNSTLLHKRVNRSEDWPGNFILLDVDEMYGHGPETLSFHNIPNGTYQIVVNQFSAGAQGTPTKDVKDGNPVVTIHVGSNVAAVCWIPDSCENKSELWNVANIKVVRSGQGAKLQVIDSKSSTTMKPIDKISIPTSLDQRSLGKYGLDKYWKWHLNSFHDDQDELDEKFVETVCQGECKLTDETEHSFETCLERSATLEGS